MVRLLRAFGFALKRRGKHDTYAGERDGRRRTAQVPRNKQTIPVKTVESILWQAGIPAEEAAAFWARKTGKTKDRR